MRTYLIIVLSIITVSASAQNEVDAVNYSFQKLSGTARSVGMGGAGIATGADFGLVNTNPAGLGLYNGSELSISSGLKVHGITATHYGEETYDSKARLMIPNIGYTAPMDVNLSGKWKSINMGVSYHLLNSFHSEENIVGTNPESSLLDVFLDQVSDDGYYDPNNDPSQYGFSSGLAWNTFLLDTFFNGQGDRYFKAFESTNHTQSRQVVTTGKSSEFNISFGANYNYRLYLGASIGIVSLDYTKRTLFSEEVSTSDTLSSLEFYNFEENLAVSGGGANLKLGAILRANDYVRLGAFLHTPTVLRLEDNWNSNVYANFGTFGELTDLSPDGIFNYRFISPLKAGVGFTFLLDKLGLIAIDYEYLDYASSALRTRSGYSFETENAQINNRLAQGNNVKAGMELRFGKFITRGGVAYLSNAFNSNQTSSYEILTSNFGIGLRSDEFYVDLTYSGSQYKESFTYLYNPTSFIPIKPTLIERSDFNLMMTVGMKF